MKSTAAPIALVLLLGCAASPRIEPAELPDVTLKNADGEPVPLRKFLSGHPTVLVFYRGSWCMFCNRHLKALSDAEPQLKQIGYRIVGISPDLPKNLQKTMKEQKVGYPLLSDTKMAAAKGFGIDFVVDDKTIELYKGYGIDLEEASGESHHELPVPAVFLIDSTGTVRFRHTDPDYKVRLSPEQILKEAKAVR